MIRSPCNLETLLHCHYSPSPHPRAEAPAIKAGIVYLLKAGMIEAKDGTCRTTPRGAAFINHLMTIPFPVETWVIPEKASEELVT